MHEIAGHKGPFVLFALFMRADAPFMRADDPGTWDLVVSAPWLDRGKLRGLEELVDLLAKSIGEQALRRLSGVQSVAGDDLNTKFILRSVPVEDGERHIQGTDLIALNIERAVIFRAWRPDTKKPLSKELHPAPAGSSRSRG
jgi:hypothetical protein